MYTLDYSGVYVTHVSSTGAPRILLCGNFGSRGHRTNHGLSLNFCGNYVRWKIGQNLGGDFSKRTDTALPSTTCVESLGTVRHTKSKEKADCAELGHNGYRTEGTHVRLLTEGEEGASSTTDAQQSRLRHPQADRSACPPGPLLTRTGAHRLNEWPEPQSCERRRSGWPRLRKGRARVTPALSSPRYRNRGAQEVALPM
ncbi:unnamed protein product [Chondrus crispus]|uniref:Uncharacterized protein n=1 Tax=Chondrus crispus TaxID=2769 RepID=R7QAS2_CHOCR|nr:unnamed protein product [Chondrus crispus]CDF34555.1 unnamed protein product [Chondrus crispus]|eukprot:XP_005714374.1 unnamed protein product [Chondrus crispus]